MAWSWIGVVGVMIGPEVVGLGRRESKYDGQSRRPTVKKADIKKAPVMKLKNATTVSRGLSVVDPTTSFSAFMFDL